MVLREKIDYPVIVAGMSSLHQRTDESSSQLFWKLAQAEGFEKK